MTGIKIFTLCSTAYFLNSNSFMMGDEFLTIMVIKLSSYDYYKLATVAVFQLGFIRYSVGKELSMQMECASVHVCKMVDFRVPVR